MTDAMRTARWPFWLFIFVGTLALCYVTLRPFFAGRVVEDGEELSANLGEIRVVNAYVAEPTTGSAPAGSDLTLYAWLYNTSKREDRLTSVTSPVADHVETSAGQLPARLPPRRWLTYAPDAEHPRLILAHLTRSVRAGAAIPITFTFDRNGTFTKRVLVMSPYADQAATERTLRPVSTRTQLLPLCRNLQGPDPVPPWRQGVS